MYHPILLEHFKNPRNVGVLPPPAHQVEVTNPVCGDILRLSALVQEGLLQQVTFLAKGCPASMACGSALTELLARQPVTSLQLFTPSMVDEAVGGLPNESKHAASLCQDAVSALLKRLAR